MKLTLFFVDSCGHSYSKEGIDGLLRRKKEVQCPFAGCAKMVSQATLKEDRVMIVNIKRIEQRKVRAEDEISYTRID